MYQQIKRTQKKKKKKNLNRDMYEQIYLFINSIINNM